MPARAASAARPIQARQRCRQYKVGCDRARPHCSRCSKSRADCIYVGSDVALAIKTISETVSKQPLEQPHSQLTPPDTETRRKDLSSRSASPPEEERPASAAPKGRGTSICGIRLHLPQHIKPIDIKEECKTSISGMSLSINFALGNLNDATITVEELLSQLPRRSIQRVFISYFMETIGKTYHIVDEAAYERELRAFWMPGSVTPEDWLGVHFVILSLGCQVYNHHAFRTGQDIYEALPVRLLRGAELCLKRTPFLFHPSLNIIKMLSLMVIAKQGLTGLIARLATSMGLQTDVPVSDEPTPYEEKMKRRVWTLAVYMEMRQSLVCGMPLLLRSSDMAALL
ncbi:hypothetical protein ARSEF1564_008692 [Beauveria bassiana]